MQSDRELLEMAARAARAAGVQVIDTEAGPQIIEWTNGSCESYRVWRPLTDDGDALRLAVKLGLQVTPGTYNKDEFSAFRAGFSEVHEYRHFQQDEFAATRRAITRAAAAIGQEKEA